MSTQAPPPPAGPSSESAEARRSVGARVRGLGGAVLRAVVATPRVIAGAPMALRRFWRAVRSGERPLAVVLAIAIVLSVVMLSGPFQGYLDGRERVAGLEAGSAALDTEIERLEQRRVDLLDTENVELLAREQLGYVRPGEVPYRLVPPEVERPTIASPRDLADEEVERPWYARAWSTVTGWLG